MLCAKYAGFGEIDREMLWFTSFKGLIHTLLQCHSPMAVVQLCLLSLDSTMPQACRFSRRRTRTPKLAARTDTSTFGDP